jgi:outer membrane protein OmpA-like peptidoglycan-associated protein
MILRVDTNYKNMAINHRVGAEQITSQQIPMDWTKPFRQALWLQNGRMRLYIDDRRVYDVNQINIPDIASVDCEASAYPNPREPEKHVGIQSARFAESVPDISQVLTSAGRYIVRGILFDTGSDRIKPESAPAIRKIATSLEENPALKLLIEGHTDSVGNAASNLDLSQRRASAVREVLIGQFKIDGSRLTAAGMGQTKPVESNDTPQGRAQNRRVELVKQ